MRDWLKQLRELHDAIMDTLWRSLKMVAAAWLVVAFVLFVFSLYT